MRSSPLILASALLLSACGAQAASIDPSGQGSITVTSSYHRSPTGGFYIEGAMSEVLLFDSSGKLVDTKQGVPAKPMTFDGLRPGRYLLKPALRPCDGTCINLDPRADSCQTWVQVRDAVNVHVRYQVDTPCTIVRQT